ncbi:hypothetical protein COLO4_12465 [Corchorus olitorius]|uniref:Uncharacterized protein n=1 Tax=Corchorus olitorius TaxID=93759 RepID=A0A1R3K0R6_9ROSI|nr:hypothetical protein COLO4_12465 [Corchorus olitorius]
MALWYGCGHVVIASKRPIKAAVVIKAGAGVERYEQG